jgi:hypothetical protein
MTNKAVVKKKEESVRICCCKVDKRVDTSSEEELDAETI